MVSLRSVLIDGSYLLVGPHAAVSPGIALASIKGQWLDAAFEILDVGNPIPFAPREPSFLRFSFESCRCPPKQRRLDAVVERADANYRANTVISSRGAEV